MVNKMLGSVFCMKKIDGYTFHTVLSITVHFFNMKLIRTCGCRYPINLIFCM